MGKHHLLYVDEDQIRNWSGDREGLLRNIGGAVFLACMSSPTFTVSVRGAKAGSRRARKTSRLTINHVGTFEGGGDVPSPSMLACTIDEKRRTMDLPAANLDLLVRLTVAMQTDQLRSEQGFGEVPKQGV
ncbi:MAG: hypothetical protein ABI216_04100 [Devosia sp.]